MDEIRLLCNEITRAENHVKMLNQKLEDKMKEIKNSCKHIFVRIESCGYDSSYYKCKICGDHK